MSGELDRVLSAEVSALAQDKEILRILGCCEWDYYAILEINPLLQDPNSLQNQIKKIYRRKTLLIHPDKTSNVEASIAFDKLKKAELVLSMPIPESNSEVESMDDRSRALINEKKRLIAIYEDVKLQMGNSEVSPNFNDKSNEAIRHKVSTILKEEIKQIEIEKNFQQRQEANKLAEIQKLQKARELKKKLENKWEDERDLRVNNWRKYTSKIEKNKEKRKKSKRKVLA